MKRIDGIYHEHRFVGAFTLEGFKYYCRCGKVESLIQEDLLTW